MKRVRIQAWTKALIVQNGRYIKMLDEGTYWLPFSYEVIRYDMRLPITTGIDINILKQDAYFVAATEIIEVQDNEMAICFMNKLFTQILKPGVHLFWKGLAEYRFEMVNLAEYKMDEAIDKMLITRPAFGPYLRQFVVAPHEKALFYVDGKLDGVKEAGTYFYWINATTLTMTKVDMRTQQLEISGQEILTKDKAALRINFYVHFQINDIVKALHDNKEFDKQLYVLMQLVLREFVGSYTLDELLEKKDSIGANMLNTVADKAAELGVELKSAGIRDIILPGEMKNIMNQVLIAEKKAQANTIMRREETASTRSLLNTAKLMEDNAMLMKLKEMEYVERITEKINHITLSGGSQIADQLNKLFVSGK